MNRWRQWGQRERDRGLGWVIVVNLDANKLSIKRRHDDDVSTSEKSEVIALVFSLVRHPIINSFARLRTNAHGQVHPGALGPARTAAQGWGCPGCPRMEANDAAHASGGGPPCPVKREAANDFVDEVLAGAGPAHPLPLGAWITMPASGHFEEDPDTPGHHGRTVFRWRDSAGPGIPHPEMAGCGCHPDGERRWMMKHMTKGEPQLVHPRGSRLTSACMLNTGKKENYGCEQRAARKKGQVASNKRKRNEKDLKVCLHWIALSVCRMAHRHPDSGGGGGGGGGLP